MRMSQGSCNGRRLGRFAYVLLACCVMVGLTLSGCGGCRTSSTAGDDKEKDKAKKKQKPDYEIGRLEVLPSDDALMRNFVKPGHTATAALPAIANNFDVRAELKSEVTSLDQAVIPIGDTSFHVRATRPAVLPKGQPKVFESTYFIPNDANKENSTLFLHHTLNSERGGSLLYENSEGTHQMLPYQYLLVVLAANPNAYGFMKTLHSVLPTLDEVLDEAGEIVYYRVVLPKIGDRVPLPSSLNAWTPIAYVLWDGLPLDKITADQQQALIEWLHWGGQLIVSGPASLDPLAGSFLAPYLPASSGGAMELRAAQFEVLNANWSLVAKKSGARQSLNVLDTAPLVGVRLRLADNSQWLEGTGELVAERRVGRGRIVVTSFALPSPEMVNWRSFDSFVNGGLLRRPARVYSVSNGVPWSTWAFAADMGPSTSGQVASSDVTEVDEFGWDTGRLQTGSASHWNQAYGSRVDPRLISSTRFFARDVAPAGTTSSENAGAAGWSDDGCQPHATGGMASWNDGSGASLLAHAALRKAAGISIPKARFVFSVLAIYLLVLVPVNWTVFRLMGRVEWAWVAAPVIALIGAVAVIRLAQLDIGFVRSRTEIGVLEMQVDRPRAHLTRYTALYSSLSTAYEFQFEDPAAVARPFIPTPSPDTPWPIETSRDDGTRISGFQVDSSTTGFIHSEQMCELEGTVRLKDAAAGEWQVDNGSGLNLRDVRIVTRGADGVLAEGKLAELSVGSSGRVRREPVSSSTNAPATNIPQDDPNVRELADLALHRMTLHPGDVRLVAWTDDVLPGLEIEPAASQVLTRTVVVMHLRYGALPPPRPDENMLADVYDATVGPPPTEDFSTETPGGQEKQAPQ